MGDCDVTCDIGAPSTVGDCDVTCGIGEPSRTHMENCDVTWGGGDVMSHGGGNVMSHGGDVLYALVTLVHLTVIQSTHYHILDVDAS